MVTFVEVLLFLVYIQPVAREWDLDPQRADSKPAWCGLHTHASQRLIVHLLCSRERHKLGYVREWYLVVSEVHTLDGSDVPKELERLGHAEGPQGASRG